MPRQHRDRPTDRNPANERPSANEPPRPDAQLPADARADDPDRRPLPGSEREPLPGARNIGPVDPSERVEVTLVLRPRENAGPQLERLESEPIGERRYLSRAALARDRGADPGDVAAVRAFAREHGLGVVRASPVRRQVVLSGSAAAMSAAFGVELQRWSHETGTYRGRVGAVRLPARLVPSVVAVLGLDNRPQARAHSRRVALDPDERSPAASGGRRGVRRVAAPKAYYSPLQLATIYDFPPGDGAGETVAIIELGGGFRPDDLAAYWASLNVPPPAVEAVSVDGGQNAPGSAGNADDEVALDIEVIGGAAPGAAIAVYFAPNTDRGFLDAVSAAIHDTRRRVSIISISWGGPESSWTAQAMHAFDQALQDAALAGITVFAAAGDNGSSDGVTDGLAHVDFPASSPHLTGCGGTSLSVSGTSSHEVVWDDPTGGATGGGVSDEFALPGWQSAAGIPASANPGGRVGRGVPDVSADADPSTGYRIRLNGQDLVIGGTSAVAPLWSALTARLNQALAARVGFWNPTLYRARVAAGTEPAAGAGSLPFRDVTSGSNGAYGAGPGWDACTGLGTPDGARLLDALRAGSAGSAATGGPASYGARAPRRQAYRSGAGSRKAASGRE